MLDILRVDAHGDSLPLKAVGSVSVRDARTLLVSVFDPGVSPEVNSLCILCSQSHLAGCFLQDFMCSQVLQAVEKAIRASSLGVNPVIEGNEIVVPVPRQEESSICLLYSTRTRSQNATCTNCSELNCRIRTRPPCNWCHLSDWFCLVSV